MHFDVEAVTHLVVHHVMPLDFRLLGNELLALELQAEQIVNGMTIKAPLGILS